MTTRRDFLMGLGALPVAALLPNPSDPKQAKAIVSAWSESQPPPKPCVESVLRADDSADVAVEAFVFSLYPNQFSTTQKLIWGRPNGWSAFGKAPFPFKAERLFVNVGCPGLVYIENVQAADAVAEIGAAVVDAFSFSPTLVGQRLSLPILPPWNTMQVQGTWSSLVPEERVKGFEFGLALDFQGWAYRKLAALAALPQPPLRPAPRPRADGEAAT